MKKLVFVFALVAFAATKSLAQDMPVIKITGDQKTKEYSVLFSSTSEQKVNISIEDKKGKEIITTTMMAKGFVKKFDLTKVAAGTYTWKIEFGRRTLLEEFDVLSSDQVAKLD